MWKKKLLLYDPSFDTELHTDAYSLGIAGILLQKHDDNLMPVIYFSRSTSKEKKLFILTN